ncbi:MAG: hypothetical protein PHO10_06090 [Gemmiger sp.]|nr:hypothetical protein [Gemmiger sp.]
MPQPLRLRLPRCLPQPLLWFTLLFFAGYMGGLAAGRVALPGLCAGFAEYYLDKQSFSGVGIVFAGLFLAAFVQLSFVLLAGYCAVGMGLFVAFFGVKGVFLGLCTASLYQVGGAKGLVVYWLLTWLPEISLLVLTLLLAGSAARVCGPLFSLTLGSAAPHAGGLAAPARRCLKQYLLTLFFAVFLCGFGACAAVFFASVLL